ncbi:MAG: hypothetical protein LQ343_005770 [Gyalolechia ehrenbergii]|nr:MAG: hypothetical protein LQ343_005770 [Gyalolechia ehrenbergii]
MVPRPVMITVPDPDLSPAPSRYYAADFHKLTNRRASSPSTPDFPLPNRVLPARATLSTSTADRRAFFRNDAAPCVMQGTPANFRTRQGSVKEEAGGEITRAFPRMGSRPIPGLAPVAVGVGGPTAGERLLVEATAEPEVIRRPEPAFQS